MEMGHRSTDPKSSMVARIPIHPKRGMDLLCSNLFYLFGGLKMHLQSGTTRSCPPFTGPLGFVTANHCQLRDWFTKLATLQGARSNLPNRGAVNFSKRPAEPNCY